MRIIIINSKISKMLDEAFDNNCKWNAYILKYGGPFSK